jgi:multidrug resistance efflux pump
MTTTTKTRAELESDFRIARANARAAREGFEHRRTELDKQLQDAHETMKAAEAEEAAAKYALDNFQG